MTLINDKFNVLQKLDYESIEYESQINNFFENYLEFDINIIHPDYLYQLFWNNNINFDDQILVIFKNYLKKIKNNIKNLIKKDEFNKNGLNKIIQTFIKKVKYIENIFNINKNNYYNLFHNIIISDQIIINYLENELSILSNNFTIEIKNLLINVKLINNYNLDNYIWFLKLIGTILRNNIPEIKENIILKQSYEIKLITNYILDIKKSYTFLNDDIKYIIQTINYIYVEKLITFISTNNLDELNNFFENKWDQVTTLSIYNIDFIKMIQPSISLKITDLVKNLNDDYEIQKVIKFYILLNSNNLIENHLLLIINIPKINNNLLIFINNNISNMKLCKSLLYMCYNIKDQDIFLQNYHIELIKRLLSNNVLLINEKTMYYVLSSKFKEKNLIKISNCINDYEKSYNIMNNFNIKIPLKIITTSYDSWNINYNNGFINDNNINYLVNNTLINDFINDKNNLINNKLINIILNYNIEYKKINNNKNLLWLLHYGEVEVLYNDVKIRMLPIQLIILELFNNEQIFILDILNNKLFTNYHKDYIMNIIETLKISGLLNNNNNLLTLTNNIYNSDLISIYYNCINIDPTISLDEELAHSRREIICTWINHLLKKGDKNYTELFNQINKEIRLFQLNDLLFKNAIDYMIKQDYIECINSNYRKLYY